MKIILAIVLCCLSISTKAQSDCFGKFYNFYALDTIMIKEWNDDVNGCKKLRGKYARLLENNNLIIGMPKDLFLNIFGRADSVTEDSIYIYGVVSDCKKQKEEKPESSSLDLIVIFLDNKLLSLSILITE